MSEGSDSQMKHDGSEHFYAENFGARVGFNLPPISELAQINSARGDYAQALTEREDQIIEVMRQVIWVRDHVLEFGKSSNFPVIASRLNRYIP